MSHGIIIGMTAGDIAHREHFIRQQGGMYFIKQKWFMGDSCWSMYYYS